ncbi:extracellular solute-binding protein [Brackiella oedipodis]|uniref:extracellular solute-binding protein n=1 Tax=Brackiella oedipodis TaxID=124225 RepID=UPI00048BAAD7|nr:extracellular solute-binding protein [Brackiella oedipodis]
MSSLLKKCFSALLVCGLVACGDSGDDAQDKKVVFYTNADKEATDAFTHALDKAGYQGQYILQSFGTSELGGKLLTEGKNIEADMLTMSSYYLESAQAKNQMFKKLDFDVKTTKEFPDYMAPTTVQEGTILLNTQELEAQKLERPTSFKDLTKPEYKDNLSIVDPNGSSTAWLMVQAIVDAYGDGDEGKAVINKIIDNAGSHVEQSGSAPMKQLLAGEVPVGFGLRQQAVAEKQRGGPIDFVDPTEGNFSLVEAVTVVDKGEKTNPKAMEMAQAIIKEGRAELIKSYPIALYEGETTDAANKSAYPKTFPEPLSIELLEKHKKFFHNRDH